MEFFDIDKDLEVVRNTLTGETQGRLRPNDLHVAELETENSILNEDIEYWVNAKEQEKLNYIRSLENKIKCDIDDSVFEGSSMSAIEANTNLDASVLNFRGEYEEESEQASRLRASLFNENSAACKISPLPISRKKNEILGCIASNQVTIISGHTGCGKSTQIPQYIMMDALQKNKLPNIVVVQPRRIAARSVAARVSNEMGCPLGQLVGYKIGLDKEHCSEATRLLYCTIGVLKCMIIDKKTINQWTHVILDEVHERQEDIDFLFLLCKLLLSTNSRGVKLILMSATICVDEFKQYYTREIPPHLIDVASVEHFVEFPAVLELQFEAAHQVNVFYADDGAILKHNGGKVCGPNSLENDESELQNAKLYQDCIKVCKSVIIGFDELEKNQSTVYKAQNVGKRGAVLVFLPGESEIIRVKKFLQMGGSCDMYSWWILSLHSRIPHEEHLLIFENAPVGKRKIILSTNMAESSITIPDITFVVDFCLTKNLRVDSYTNYVALRLEWADKNSCKQRAGRVGRVGCGKVVRLVSHHFFEECLKFQHEPEILRAPLNKLILDTKLLDFGPPIQLLALCITPPPLNNCLKTIMELKEMGALLRTVDDIICKDDGDITVLGEIVASLPVDVRLGKLIVFGLVFDILEDTVIIAAGLSNKSIFTSPLHEKLRSYANKLTWADGSFCDSIAVLNAYKVWSLNKRQGMFQRSSRNPTENKEQIWCSRRYLQLKSLREMEATIEDIWRSLKAKQINRSLPRPNLVSDSENFDKKCLFLKVAIFGAFYPNYFTKVFASDPRDVFRSVNGHDPMCSLYFTGFPSDQQQFAPIYVNQIKQMFTDTSLNTDLLNVDIEDSKIVVEFTRGKDTNLSSLEKFNNFSDNNGSENDNLTGEIIHQVYVGLKIKNEPFEKKRLTIYDEKSARRRLRIYETLQKEALSLRLNSDASMIGTVTPPQNSESLMLVDVVHVENPGKFWVNFTSQGIDEQIKALSSAISGLTQNQNLCLNVTNIRSLVLNNVYLALFENVYYRARVDSINLNENVVSVFYIDYGNVAKLKLVNILSMIILSEDALKKYPALVQVPAMAVQCCLAYVRPNPLRNTRGIWDKTPTNKFLQWLGECDYGPLMYIHSMTKKMNIIHAIVVLFEPGVIYSSNIEHKTFESSMCFNQILVNEKHSQGFSLAIKCEESYSIENRSLCIGPFPTNASLENTPKAYDFRELTEIVSQSETSTVSGQSSVFEMDKRTYVEEESEKDKRRHAEEDSDDTENEYVKHVCLRGPYHPLFINISCIHRIGSSKETRVETSSVNSILLDRYPLDSWSQWLVAAHVGLSADSNTLLLRSTTFMPNLKGLGSLLTMMFAPCIELRVDDVKQPTRYTGLIAGLGFRPKSWEARTLANANFASDVVSYNAEHDMELEFDVEITDKDIILINKIRFWINKLLSRALVDHILPDAVQTASLLDRNRYGVFYSQPQNVIQVQTSVKQHLNNLLDTNRPSKKLHYKPKRYMWNLIPPKLIRKHEVNRENGFLALINVVKMRS